MDLCKELADAQKRLRTLYLTDTKVTDAGLKELTAIKNLTDTRPPVGTKVTAAGVRGTPEGVAEVQRIDQVTHPFGTARLPENPVMSLSPSPTISRRQLLQLGGIGIMGLGLPRLLHAATESRGKTTRPKSCIFIVQYGGCSQIDSLDPKPDAPVEQRGPFQTIATAVPGTRLCEHLPRLARIADRFAIVRSMTHGNGGHDGGMHVAMTGHSQPVENTPYYGSIVAKLCPAGGNVPPYVWLQNLAGDVQPRYLTGGFLGAQYSPLRIGTDQDNPAAPGFRVKAFDPPVDVPASRLLDRQELLNRVETAGRTPHGSGDLQTHRERAVDLLTGPDAQRAFDLDREPARVRDRYGRHPLGQNLLMARRLIEAGTRLVSVTAWTGNPPGEKFVNVQTWDMHGPGAASAASSARVRSAWAGLCREWMKPYRHFSTISKTAGCSKIRWS